LAAGVLIGETSANLGPLPPFCQLTALPLNIEGGSGAPLRALAEIG
jgi:kynurenine formamidase